MVRIWDVRTSELLERLPGHTGSVWSVTFTPDGRGLVSGSLDKTLKYWDVSRYVNTRGGSSACTMNYTGHKVRVELLAGDFSNHRAQDYVHSVAVSHDGKWVASGSNDHRVQFWDARSGIVQLMLQGHKDAGLLSLRSARVSWTDGSFPLVRSIDLSPAGGLLATSASDGRVRVCKSRYSPEFPSASIF